MSDNDNEAQIVRDLKMLNGYAEDMPQSEIFNREAIRLAMLDPTARACHIRDLENKITNYDNGNSNLRCRAQGWRLTQTLKTADRRLKLAGR
jgi:hypothetical protein